jgi:hypothetical protein
MDTNTLGWTWGRVIVCNCHGAKMQRLHHLVLIFLPKWQFFMLLDYHFVTII